MFERYTEAARRAIFFARYEASQFASAEIEPYHLLLALIRPDAIGGLLDPATTSALRSEIETAHLTMKEAISTSTDLPVSPALKNVLTLAAQEADRMHRPTITPAHLLAGIILERTSSAARVLEGRGITLEMVRKLEVRFAPAETDSETVSNFEAITVRHITELIEALPAERRQAAAEELRALAQEFVAIAVAGRKGSFSYSFGEPGPQV